MPFIQFLALAKRPHPAFQSRADYAELWGRLREKFPSILAAALMPNHVHLALETPSPDQVYAEFVQALAAYARSRRRSIWSKIDPPERLLTQLHVLRSIRYIHLNPCRDKLTRDPLTWEWTTHRDALGAVGDPWSDLAAIRRMLNCPPEQFRTKLHAYVSADPSVAVQGTPLPRAVTPGAASLHAVRNAILLATRQAEIRRGGPGRKLVVHLARRVGPSKCTELAGILRVTPKTITLLARTPLRPAEARAVTAGQGVLADSRLLLRID